MIKETLKNQLNEARKILDALKAVNDELYRTKSTNSELKMTLMFADDHVRSLISDLKEAVALAK